MGMCPKYFFFISTKFPNSISFKYIEHIKLCCINKIIDFSVSSTALKVCERMYSICQCSGYFVHLMAVHSGCRLGNTHLCFPSYVDIFATYSMKPPQRTEHLCKASKNYIHGDYHVGEHITWRLK